ncbi:MAG: XrtB/PEP-CTERM-associated polysaccharide biosynthesis outer membrane protein EpsL [Vicinamibacterales bacterium]
MRWLRAVLVSAAVLVPTPDAAALWDDKLELFIAESVTYDDNVFRISSRADPVAIVGSPSRGDTYTTTSPGFNLGIPYGRQRFVGGVKWNYTRYNRFKVLDFDGHEGRAAWQWQLGNDLSGQLGYTETLALESLANSRAGILTGTPNSLETQRAYFDANWQLTPRWLLRGEASRLDQDNGLATRAVNDIIIEGAGLAVSYVTPARNKVGVGARVEEGRYPNRPDLAANPAVDAYRQHNVDVIADYTLTGLSRVRARAGWVSRSYEQLTQRDFDEGTYNVDYDWQATGKLAVNAVARREVSPLDETYSSFVLLTGFALNPTLRMTEKITAALNLEYSSRDYLADPTLLLVQSRTDWVRTAALKLSYRPLRSVMLEMLLGRQTRSSTFPLADYEDNIANVTVRIGI